MNTVSPIVVCRRITVIVSPIATGFVTTGVRVEGVDVICFIPAITLTIKPAIAVQVLALITCIQVAETRFRFIWIAIFPTAEKTGYRILLTVSLKFVVKWTTLLIWTMDL